MKNYIKLNDTRSFTNILSYSAGQIPQLTASGNLWKSEPATPDNLFVSFALARLETIPS